MLSGVLGTKHLNIKIDTIFIKNYFPFISPLYYSENARSLFKLCEQVECIMCQFNFGVKKETLK